MAKRQLAFLKPNTAFSASFYGMAGFSTNNKATQMQFSSMRSFSTAQPQETTVEVEVEHVEAVTQVVQSNQAIIS